jgi:hypothetical protein
VRRVVVHASEESPDVLGRRVFQLSERSCEALRGSTDFVCSQQRLAEKQLASRR